jgi:hypothetical protein
MITQAIQLRPFQRRSFHSSNHGSSTPRPSGGSASRNGHERCSIWRIGPFVDFPHQQLSVTEPITNAPGIVPGRWVSSARLMVKSLGFGRPHSQHGRNRIPAFGLVMTGCSSAPSGDGSRCMEHNPKDHAST